MSTLTLDQLLDATGISEMAGTHLKEASETPEKMSFSKLADRCRRALATPEPSVDDIDNLAEKTAAVEIIRRTLSEIRELDNPPEIEKAATQAIDHSTFIRVALAEGHAPEEVAYFLEKQGGVSVPPGTKPVVQGTPVRQGPGAMLPGAKKRRSSTNIVR